MAKKTSSSSTAHPEVAPSIDHRSAIGLFERQIQKATELLRSRPLQSSDHAAWKNTTKDYLIKAFGSASPNVNAVLHAASDHGLYMGMGDSQIEIYNASQLANQIKMLLCRRAGKLDQVWAGETGPP